MIAEILAWLQAREKQREDAARYQELMNAVLTVRPDETKHEIALRCLQAREANKPTIFAPTRWIRFIDVEWEE